jgi:hypothetical protein
MFYFISEAEKMIRSIQIINKNDWGIGPQGGALCHSRKHGKVCGAGGKRIYLKLKQRKNNWMTNKSGAKWNTVIRIEIYEA